MIVCQGTYALRMGLRKNCFTIIYKRMAEIPYVVGLRSSSKRDRRTAALGEFVDLVSTDREIFEIITAGQPIRPYYDVDIKLDGDLVVCHGARWSFGHITGLHQWPCWPYGSCVWHSPATRTNKGDANMADVPAYKRKYEVVLRECC